MSEEDSIHELKRQKIIDDLKELLRNTKDISPDCLQLFDNVIDALEELTLGVNSAHVRISVRKRELRDVNNNINKLAYSLKEINSDVKGVYTHLTEIQKKITTEIAIQNKKNRRFYIGISLASLVIIGFMAYIVFGSKETLTVLNSLTAVMKTLDVFI